MVQLAAPAGERPLNPAELIYELAGSGPSGKLAPEETPEFTRHMIVAEHEVGVGWSAPRLTAVAPLAMHPGAQVFHYGLCCFEGLKAYADESGEVRLFRPDANFARLRRSAGRLLLADPDPEAVLALTRALLVTDRAWVRSHPFSTVYLRPFMFSSSPTLGVKPPTRSTLCILACMAPTMVPASLPAPQLVYVEETARRAFPGGAGSFKVGSNYAPTLLPGARARDAFGAGHVLYTVPEDPSQAPAGTPPGAPPRLLLSECGAMNVFFLLERTRPASPAPAPAASPAAVPIVKFLELVTPPLDDCILPGVTRDSLLQLAREWAAGSLPSEAANRLGGLPLVVSERPISVDELSTAAAAGRLIEAFGCGTAYVVQPIEAFLLDRGNVRAAAAYPAPGVFTTLARSALLDIQFGRVPSPWSVPVGALDADREQVPASKEAAAPSAPAVADGEALAA